jgi:glyoxylase-like metal-dependent hydrolase (beta-lactamase superfamily II)
MSRHVELDRFATASGIPIYRLPVEAFPNHYTNCYLILADDRVILIDVASGWATGNEQLLALLAQVCDQFGEKVAITDIDTLILTHGHIDHFGGALFLREQSPGLRLGIHELDAKTLRNIEERVIVTSKNLEIFLERAGLRPEPVIRLTEMNKFSKDMFHSTTVDFLINPAEILEGLFQVFHTPGHCPGQVCLLLDDILFSADHVLARTTPIQSPEYITRHTGLDHYLESLKLVEKIPGIRLALGGHEAEIPHFYDRVDEIRNFHHDRLQKVLDLCREPATIKEISRGLFSVVSGYNVLLALLETGAHVEHLYERGHLRVVNLDEVERNRNPALLYQRL